MSKDLIEKFNGVVPDTLEELTTLSGVGRKTANVIMSVAYNKQAIAVDTHVHRISKRLGLTKQNSTPLNCEIIANSIIKQFGLVGIFAKHKILNANNAN